MLRDFKASLSVIRVYWVVKIHCCRVDDVTQFPRFVQVIFAKLGGGAKFSLWKALPPLHLAPRWLRAWAESWGTSKSVTTQLHFWRLVPRLTWSTPDVWHYSSLYPRKIKHQYCICNIFSRVVPLRFLALIFLYYPLIHQHSTASPFLTVFLTLPCETQSAQNIGHSDQTRWISIGSTTLPALTIILVTRMLTCGLWSPASWLQRRVFCFVITWLRCIIG